MAVKVWVYLTTVGPAALTDLWNFGKEKGKKRSPPSRDARHALAATSQIPSTAVLPRGGSRLWGAPPATLQTAAMASGGPRRVPESVGRESLTY